MKVIIAGSRGLDKIEFVREAVTKSRYDIHQVVSGGARGVDQVGEQWARENNIPIIQFIPTWTDKDGKVDKSAGFRRNMEMGIYADALIAVWDGSSRGTQHMIRFMQSLNKPLYTQIFKD